MEYQKCPVCKMPASVRFTDPLADDHVVDCCRCGRFRLIEDSAWFLAESRLEPFQRAAISGYIRRNTGLTISRDRANMLCTLKPLPLVDKRARFLSLLSKRHPIPGSNITAPVTSIVRLETLVRDSTDGGPYPDGSVQTEMWQDAGYMGEAALVDNMELHWLIYNCLMEAGHLATGRISGTIQITSSGWDEIARLQKVGIESRVGFVAMSFKAIFLALYDSAIEPAIRRAGYEALRIDRTPHNNRIDDEIIARIKQSRFLVADFSLNRGGIYFEAGLAMGLGIPVIWVVREDRLKGVHFDTRQFNYLTWTSEDYLALGRALTLRIEATIGRGPLIAT